MKHDSAKMRAAKAAHAYAGTTVVLSTGERVQVPTKLQPGEAIAAAKQIARGRK